MAESQSYTPFLCRFRSQQLPAPHAPRTDPFPERKAYPRWGRNSSRFLKEANYYIRRGPIGSAGGITESQSHTPVLGLRRFSLRPFSPEFGRQRILPHHALGYCTFEVLGLRVSRQRAFGPIFPSHTLNGQDLAPSENKRAPRAVKTGVPWYGAH